MISAQSSPAKPRAAAKAHEAVQRILKANPSMTEAEAMRAALIECYDNGFERTKNQG